MQVLLSCKRRGIEFLRMPSQVLPTDHLKKLSSIDAVFSLKEFLVQTPCQNRKNRGLFKNKLKAFVMMPDNIIMFHNSINLYEIPISLSASVEGNKARKSRKK